MDGTDYLHARHATTCKPRVENSIFQSAAHASHQKTNEETLAKTDSSLSKIPSRLLRRIKGRPFFFSTYPIPSSKTHTGFASLVSEPLPHKTISSWNSFIIEFTRKHRFSDSLLSFKTLLLSPVKPDHSTFPPLLTSCSGLAYADTGLGLHGFIVKYGFSSSNVICNSIVSMYVKFGRAKDAVYAFDEIPVRDASSYNSLIWQFGVTGFHEEVLMIFDWMQNLRFSPSSYSVARVILACGELGWTEKGALIHDFAIRNGFELDTLIANSLISMYTKVGRLDRARWLFNDMPRRDLVSWNSMVIGYARSGNWAGAFDVFQFMKVENFVPNYITFLGLILACAQAGELDMGETTHGHLIRRGLLWDVRVGTSIVDMYSKLGRVDCARAVFEVDLYDRNLISWNSLIAGYSQNGHDYEAVELFLRMLHDRNVKPDPITIASVIPAYASLADLQGIQSIHEFVIKKGFELHRDVVLGTAIVDAYCKCLDIEAASFFFNHMEKPNTATWNAMIHGYNLNGQAPSSMRLFLGMFRGEALLDSVTLVTVLQSCGEMGSLEQGMCIHGYCLSSGFASYLPIANAMIDMYLICGCVRSSQVLFKSMSLRNVVTWNTMLSGSIKLGLFRFAIKLFRQMLLENQHYPDHVTMISVIQAGVDSAVLSEALHGLVLKIGLDSNTLVTNSLIDAYSNSGCIENAWSLFEQMGHLRDQSSWNVMITGCGMNGRGEEACSLISRMEEDGHKPNSITFISLLSSCSHSGMVDKGCEYFNQMVKKYGIQPGPEHYTCMIDMFGRAGRLEEAYRLVDGMQEGSDCGIVWGALLGACRTSTNLELGKLVGERLSKLAPDNCGYHSLLSNVYASAGRWEEAAKMRSVFEDGKLIKKPGLSVLKI